MNSVFVTGANRGIGLEFVRQLARRNPRPSHVFASCRNPPAAKDLQTVAAGNDNIHIVGLDVQNEATYGQAVEAVSSVVGEKGLNVLISNAGVMGSRESYAKASRESLTAVMDVNVISLIRLTQVFLPLLRQAAVSSKLRTFSFERAAIINISSILGSIAQSNGGFPGYRESKAAVNMITKSLSVELKEDQILVLAQHPGWVQTDMGGANADVTPQESVSTMLQIFSQASEKEHGLFLSHKFPIQICPY